MSNAATGILQGLQVGNGLIHISPKRGFFNPTLTANGQQVVLPDIIAQATFEEHHIDRMEITRHPVEQGAAISDHAFAEPSIVHLRLGWSNSSSQGQLASAADIARSWGATLGGTAGQVIGAVSGAVQAGYNLLSVSGQDAVNEAYQNLLIMYYSRALFTLYTAKRVYSNMICKMVATETDWERANSMVVVVECEQIILVNTKTVALDLKTQSNPASTASPISAGTQQAIQR